MKSKLLTKKSLVLFLLVLVMLVAFSFLANATIVTARIEKMAYQREYSSQTSDDGLFLFSFAPDEAGNKYASIARFSGGDYNVSVANTPHEYNSIQVLAVEEDAYAGFESLESVTLPQTIVRIGKNAFSGCENLKELYVPASVQKISDDAFTDTENFTMYVEKGSYAEDFAKKNGIKFENYTPEPLKPITKMKDLKTVFGARYKDLTYDILYFNNTPFCAVTSFNAQGASNNCVIPQQIDGVDVTVILDEAFFTRSSVESITLPSTVTFVGQQAFAECRELKKVYFSENVTTIEDDILLDSPNAIICAPKNSYAHQYAVEHKIKYEEYAGPN